MPLTAAKSICGNQWMPDEMSRVSWGGRECPDCASEARQAFEDDLDYYGTD